MDIKTKKFLDKLKKSGHWNDNYDYSKVVYVYNKTPVIVIDKKFNTEHLLVPVRMLSGLTSCSGKTLKNGYYSFDKTINFVHNLKIESVKKWNEYCVSGEKPHYITGQPNLLYKNKWVSWGHFLGTDRIADCLKKETLFRPFEDTKNFVHGLKLKNENEWRAYLKSGNKPVDIPSDCAKVYKDSGWISWPDFLGLKRKIGKDFLPYEESKKIISSFKINGKDEYVKLAKTDNFPINIPKLPSSYYKNSGWVSWSEWLGIERISNKNKSKLFCLYDEAEEYAKNLNLNNIEEWEKHINTNELPINIPRYPNNVYKGKGWVSWGQFLGTGRIADIYKEFLPYEEAKVFIKKLGFTSERQWREYVKSGLKPDNIPANPESHYSKIKKI